MESKRIQFLLVGGNGFLGRGLRKQLDERGLGYVVVDRAEDRLRPCEYVQMDLCDTDMCSDKLASLVRMSDNVVLLASMVGAEYFSRSPVEGYLQNTQILNTCVESILKSSNSKVGVVWYSTSEVYGRVFCDSGLPHVEYDDGRSLYSQVKLAGETVFKQMLAAGGIGSLRIFRPFNVTGFGQSRGVVYDMVSSALSSGRICYADDTYRTLTPLDTASRIAVCSMLKPEKFELVDIVDRSCCTSMYQLAVAVAVYFINRTDIAVVKNPPDEHVRKRAFKSGSEYNMSAVLKMIEEVEMGMKAAEETKYGV